MSNIPVKTEPVACLLDGESYRTRIARMKALMEHALIARERGATAVRLRFRTDAGVEAHLKELIALEQECCPFLAFDLTQRPGEIVLTISGPESATALLDDAFGGTAACS
jgi:hypothetical protein